MEDDETQLELEESDHMPSSYDRKMSKWLVLSHTIWIIVGIIGFVLYWNGSHGFLDRGYWQKLQQAANTTYPFSNANVREER